MRTASFGAMERWDGQRGFGPLNARHAMARAVELAHQFGIGMVALGNNNHWMRGGTYGWQAADAGCIGICSADLTDAVIDAIAADVAASEPAEPGREVRCPGMGEHRSRKENMELGIPVAEEKWAEVLAM